MRVERPWGWFEVLHEDKECKVKMLCINPGCRTSLQSHQKRGEQMTVVSGTATVTWGWPHKFPLEVSVFKLYSTASEPDRHLCVPHGVVHRIANQTTIPLRIIEVQTGESFDEEDIIRYEDDYGRADNKTT